MRDFESVHDAHCCPVHGCKYGQDDCPVVTGQERGFQEGCEDCEIDRKVMPSPEARDARQFMLQHAEWLRTTQTSAEGQAYYEKFVQALDALS